MAFLNYYIEYYDVANVLHRVEISTATNTGINNVRVYGTAVLQYGDHDEVLNPIKGVGLRIALEASETENFSSLYTEFEKDHYVTYKRDGVVKFNGWIDPEGWYEDFTNNRWMVTFDCLDGLSYLNNLSYVDHNGHKYTDKESLIQTVANCLLKTGVQQDIRVDVGLAYAGMTETEDIMANAKIDAVRFIRDDNDTVMSCSEVLSSVLNLVGACLVSVDGVWYIYRPNQLYSDSEMSYFAYDYGGTATTPATGTKELAFELGSEIDGYYPCHAQKNQSITRKKSLGGYRINYKYGIQKGLLDNIYLEGDGNTVDEWTIDNNTGFSIPTSNAGFTLRHEALYPDQRIIYSDNMAVFLDDLITVKVKYDTTWVSGGSISSNQYARTKLICVGAQTYYYTGTRWTTTDSFLDLIVTTTDTSYVDSWGLKMPITGNLRMEHWTPIDDAGSPSVFEVYFHETSFTPAQDQGDSVEGEIHTFRRTDRPTSKIKKTLEVFNGDNFSSIYVGAIFQSDGLTLTRYWKRKGVTEQMPILQMLGEETMRLYGKTMKVFSGTIYGHISYLSVVQINGLSGIYLVTKYTYDTVGNTTDVELMEIFADALTDVSYEQAVDDGNVVEPTIANYVEDALPPTGDETPPLEGTLDSVTEQ